VLAEPDRYQVVALAAHRSTGALAGQAARLRPAVVAVAVPAPRLRTLGEAAVVGRTQAAAARIAARLAGSKP